MDKIRQLFITNASVSIHVEIMQFWINVFESWILIDFENLVYIEGLISRETHWGQDKILQIAIVIEYNEIISTHKKW